MQTLLALVLAVVGANILFFRQPVPYFGTVGYFLSVLLAFGVLLLRFFQVKESFRQTMACAAGLFAVAFAGLALFRASEVDGSFLGIGSLLSLCYALYLFGLEHEIFGSATEALMIPLRVAGRYFVAGIQVSSYLPLFLTKGIAGFHREIVEKINKRIPVTQLLRGTVITGIVVFVLIGLLSSADPVFSRTISGLFSFSLPTIIISVPQRIIFSVIVALFVSPLARFTVKEQHKSPFVHKQFSHLTTELLMVTVAVAAILGFFLLIQVRYLFFAVPDVTLQSFGIPTYSEYVRRGFGELTLVSLIVYGIVAVSMVTVRQSGAKKLLQANLVLLGEIILLIGSVFRRLALYQAQHGLTRIRIYGTAFLCTIFVLTIILIWRHISKSGRRFYLYEMGALFGSLLVVGMLNVDATVAKVFRPTVNGEVDYTYIVRLSPDAVGGWLDAVADARAVISDPVLSQKTVFDDKEARRIVYTWRTMSELYSQVDHLYSRYGSSDEEQILAGYRGYVRMQKTSPSILSVNISEWQAYQTLRKTLSLQKFLELETQARKLHDKLTPRQQQMIYDRSLSSPLVK